MITFILVSLLLAALLTYLTVKLLLYLHKDVVYNFVVDIGDIVGFFILYLLLIGVIGYLIFVNPGTQITKYIPIT